MQRGAIKLGLDGLPGMTFENTVSARITSVLKMQKRSSFHVPHKKSFPYVSDSVQIGNYEERLLTYQFITRLIHRVGRRRLNEDPFSERGVILYL